MTEVGEEFNPFLTILFRFFTVQQFLIPMELQLTGLAEISTGVIETRTL